MPSPSADTATASCPRPGAGCRICARCVMDTTDPQIAFDDAGVCNHCHTFDEIARKRWHPGPRGRELLRELVAAVRERGKGQDYDCILGMSGGVDSSYMALKTKELALRPLVVHVDTGWNSELAVSNIERIVKYCDYELHTEVMDWEEMRDLQLAYFRAGVANQDVPQDHAIFATLYHFAVRNGITTVLSGGNIATEAVFPSAWHASAMDATNLRAIHRRYGKVRLRHYRTISFVQYYFWYPLVRKMTTLRPLNYLSYDRAGAMAELTAVGWRPYGRKHGESLFTRFFQNYYLPVKFGYDKRRPHLSSMILSGQMSREAALKALEQPLYTPQELETDIGYFCKKLGISRAIFDRIMREPNRGYRDFRNWDRKHRMAKGLQATLERATSKKYNVYS